MKWDEIYKVFSPGDYSFDLWWFDSPEALPTVFALGSTLQAINPMLEIIQHEGELFHFDWNSLQRAIENSVKELIQLRGNDRRIDSDSMIFRTGMEGVDLQLVLRISEEKPPVIRFAGLDFDEVHLKSGVAVFSNHELRALFRESVLALNVDYAVLRRIPPVTEVWYQETRVSIDTTKVPVTIEWFNFFSWSWVRRIGKRKFQNPSVGEVAELPTGILYFLQEEPFSYDNSEHRRRQQRAHKHFNLDKLHKKYPCKYSY